MKRKSAQIFELIKHSSSRVLIISAALIFTGCSTSNPLAPAELTTNTLSVGTALPTDNNPTAVEGLDPNTVVTCGAPSLRVQNRTLQLINEARSEPRICGTESFQATNSLVWNTQLLQSAEKHSADMAQHNFFDHTGSNGSSIGERVDETGYNWLNVGENIAAGQSSASEAIAGWLDSPGHCRNLMDPTFTEVAVTCAEDDGADYTQYWTNVLATPQ